MRAGVFVKKHFLLITLLLLGVLFFVDFSFNAQIGGNSVGDLCVDCIELVDYQSRSSSGAEVVSLERNYRGNPSFDCLGDIPDYKILLEDHWYSPDGVMLADASCSVEGGDCVFVKNIRGSSVVYTGGDIRDAPFIAYKPRQYVESDLSCPELLSSELGVDNTVVVPVSDRSGLYLLLVVIGLLGLVIVVYRGKK